MPDPAANSSSFEDQDKQNKINTPEISDIFSSSFANPPKFVDQVVLESISLTASDLLFEPRQEFIIVRVRIDGVLYELGTVSLQIYSQVSSRFKVLCNLDPTEKRKIQEGQYSISDYNGAVVNLRVEIAQTIHGELIVIRIHKKETIIMDITQLGFGNVAFTNYQNMLKERSGLILACGPTGCGKTTTLYSTLTILNEKKDLNIMTIENPVEFQLEDINQMQTQDDIGFTFASGLKTILRLTPDVVLVGEIRDKETAEIAVESGLTGQLVLSTLHADDSVGALFRLLDLGIETYFVNSSLVGVISQRLVRRVCLSCKEVYNPTPAEIELFKEVMGRAPKQIVKGRGCPVCKNLGYKGRLGIFEVLVMNSSVRDLVRERMGEDVIRKKLVEGGFPTLLKDGLEKAEGGLTTIEEVLRSSFRVF